MSYNSPEISTQYKRISGALNLLKLRGNEIDRTVEESAKDGLSYSIAEGFYGSEDAYFVGQMQRLCRQFE
jgi:hypothetical protein